MERYPPPNALEKPNPHRWPRGLDRHELIHQRFVDATSKPTQHFGKHKVILATIYLDFLDSAGIHHPEVGAQPMT